MACYLSHLTRTIQTHPEFYTYTCKPTIWKEFGLYKRSLAVYSAVKTPRIESTLHQGIEHGRTLNNQSGTLAFRSFHTSQVACKEKARGKQLAEARSQGEVTIGKKVVQAGTDVMYTGFILLGLGIAGVLFYAVGRELLSSQTPQGVFTTALKMCRKNDEVSFELGDPIKGRGERNSRGRARHVSHAEYQRDGVEHMRIQFYLKGSIRQGTAHCEVRKNDSGKWEFRYLFVEVEKTYPPKTIIIQDNR